MKRSVRWSSVTNLWPINEQSRFEPYADQALKRVKVLHSSWELELKSKYTGSQPLHSNNFYLEAERKNSPNLTSNQSGRSRYSQTLLQWFCSRSTGCKENKNETRFYPFNLLLCKKGDLTVNIIIYYHHFVLNSVFCISCASGIALKSQIGWSRKNSQTRCLLVWA